MLQDVLFAYLPLLLTYSNCSCAFSDRKGARILTKSVVPLFTIEGATLLQKTQNMKITNPCNNVSYLMDKIDIESKYKDNEYQTSNFGAVLKS